jgi:hypothetical protein
MDGTINIADFLDLQIVDRDNQSISEGAAASRAFSFGGDMFQQEHETSFEIYAAAAPLSLTPPHGVEEIIATFGDIHEYVRKDGSLDPRWETEFLTRIALPFPLTLSWDHKQAVKEMTCHKKLSAVFVEVLSKVQANDLQAKIQTFGGCFSFRQQRTGTRLSTHAWGIAIDLNPETNGQGTIGDMDPGVIEIFKDAGFSWGGDWKGKVRDPMHFQFCSGY